MALQIEKADVPDLLMIGIDEPNYSDAAKLSAFRRLQQVFITLDIPYEVAEHVMPSDTVRIVTVDASYIDEMKTIATIFGKESIYAAKYAEDDNLIVKDAAMKPVVSYTNKRTLKLVAEKQAKKTGSYLHLVGDGLYYSTKTTTEVAS